MLKIIACLTMLIDHVGYTFFPQALWLRVIGRLAFPLFAWYVAAGFRRTHSRWRYMARLAGWGILSQIPFALLFHNATPSVPLSFVEGTNVLFTFFFAVLGLQLIAICKKSHWSIQAASWVVAALLAAAAQKANTDYGAYGVVIVLLFYFLDANAAEPVFPAGVSGSRTPAASTGSTFRKAGPAVLAGVPAGRANPVDPAESMNVSMTHMRNGKLIRRIVLPLSIFLVTLLSLGLIRMHPVQLFCILAVPLTYAGFPDPKPGRWKYVFYAFYPVHIMLIWFVTLI
jgi:hypothetical protein